MATLSYESTDQPSAGLDAANAHIQRLEESRRRDDAIRANAALTANDRLIYQALLRLVPLASTKDTAGRSLLLRAEIAANAGCSINSVTRSIKVLAECGLVDRTLTLTEGKGQKQDYMNLWVGLQPVETERLRTVRPAKKRGSGGDHRYTCPKCGGHHLRKKTKIVSLKCRDCKHETSERDAWEARQRELGLSEGVTPNWVCQNQEGEEAHQIGAMLSEAETEAIYRRCADLLVAIDAQHWRHIQQPVPGERTKEGQEKTAKYYIAYHPLTQAQALGHIKGKRARGSWCQAPDGTTRILIADGDNPAATARLREAARKLDEAGWLVLLEMSPTCDSHQGGAHLIVLFDGPVNARAAWAEALRIAPELATVAEHWPHLEYDKGRGVRLPGAYYYRAAHEDGGREYPAVEGWCRLLAVHTGEQAEEGLANAKLLLANLNRTSLVPHLPPEQELPAPPERPAVDVALAGEPDTQHRAKYGEQPSFLVRFTPKDLIEEFNRTHGLDELHPREKTGLAIAIWRGEKGASVQYSVDESGREYWCDHGRHGDFPHGGDALDLWVLVNRRPSAANFKAARAQVLRELGQAAHRQAKASAALAQTAGREEAEAGGLPSLEPESPAGMLLQVEIARLGRAQDIRSSAPCLACGGTTERLKLGVWVCAGCHPNPFAKERHA